MNTVLTINPNTFLWMEGNFGLLYDSRSYISYEFEITSSIEELCLSLINPDNLYSVTLDMSSTDPYLKNFIEKIVACGFGLLHDNMSGYLVSYPPLLNIQNSWEKICKRGNDAYCEVLQYLSSVTVYTGGKCVDTELYKQTIYPVNSIQCLSSETILRFIASIYTSHLSKINIVFSSMHEYHDRDELLDGLKDYEDIIAIYLRAEELTHDSIKEMIRNNSGFSWRIIYTFGCNVKIDGLSNEFIKQIFLVTSRKEYLETVEQCIRNNVEHYDIVPVFNGDNIDFFEDEMMVTKEEILGRHLERREVFAHMSVNVNYWGHFSVMPDGGVYANLNDNSIGSINDSIYNLIENEMRENTAWRYTRDNKLLCSKCLLKYLCPSPSSYEYVMNLNCICIGNT